MFALPLKLREYRRKREMTQEDVAAVMGGAPQTVSKWERAENYPDITLLPALANLFETTTDALLGMEELRQEQQQGAVYTCARKRLRRGEWAGAIQVYETALTTWPNDAGLLTDLAMALALAGGEAQLTRAAELCERVLAATSPVKIQHTARAALCYIHALLGNHEKAMQKAHQLPHMRESREIIGQHLLAQDDWKALIYELSTGENMCD